MKKHVLIPVLLLAVLLSGCITVRIETRIKKDGSGVKSYVLALDRSVTSMIASMAQESGASMDDIWAEARANAGAIEGARVEDYRDEDIEGIQVSVPFENLDELQALSSSDTFEGVDSVTVSKTDDTLTLKAVVKAVDLTSGLSEAGGEDLEGFDLGEIELEYTYAVEVEGKILEHSPQEIARVKGSKVTWDLSQASAETVELMVRWKPGGGSKLLPILAAVALAGGVILIAVGGVLVIRKRKPSDQ